MKPSVFHAFLSLYTACCGETPVLAFESEVGLEHLTSVNSLHSLPPEKSSVLFESEVAPLCARTYIVPFSVSDVS